jgi:hypothetical protein
MYPWMREIATAFVDLELLCAEEQRTALTQSREPYSAS